MDAGVKALVKKATLDKLWDDLMEKIEDAQFAEIGSRRMKQLSEEVYRSLGEAYDFGRTDGWS